MNYFQSGKQQSVFMTVVDVLNEMLVFNEHNLSQDVFRSFSTSTVMVVSISAFVTVVTFWHRPLSLENGIKLYTKFIKFTILNLYKRIKNTC